MRAILGLLMIMLGLAMAVIWMPESDGERQLASLTEIATQGLPRHTGAPPARPQTTTPNEARTFSPRAPLIAAEQQLEDRLPQQQANPLPTVTIYGQAAEATQGGPAMSVVTGAVAASTTVGLDSATRTASVIHPQPATAPTREELVRDLQRELKRVGCYWGDVDGSWGTGSKRAMGVFVERINASLPVDQPDIVLLTLLQSHAGSACGKDCPRGLSMTQGGHCMPASIVAQSGRTAVRRPPQGEARAPQETAHAGEAGRTAPASQANQWSTRIQRETGESIAIAPLTATAPVAAAPPLPGRMSIGGPGAGAYVAPAMPPTPASGAIQAAAEPERQSATSRKRTRRAAASRQQVRLRPPPVAFRAYYMGQPQAWRAPRPSAVPRIATPRYYVSTARRTASRNWTATFFNQ